VYVLTYYILNYNFIRNFNYKIMFIVFYNRISFIIHIQTYCRWTLKKYSERDILRDYGNCNNLRKC